MGAIEQQASLFMSNEDVVKMTGFKYPSKQIEWLRENHYRFEINGLDRPVVYIEPPLKRVTELESAVRAFIDENKHLADGDNCTLAGLKQVIGGDDD